MPAHTTLAAGVMAAFSVSALLAQSQNPPIYYRYAGAADSARKPETPPAVFPAVMRVCTEPDKQPEKKSCDVWTLSGDHYTAQRAQGASGIMVMEKFTRENVVLRITDPARPGLNGTIRVLGGAQSSDGSSVPDGVSMDRDGTVGLFQAYWGSALEGRTASAPEHAASTSSAVPVPKVLHFCAAHCLTFTMERDGTLVNYTNLPGQHDVRRVLTIQKWTPDAVVIHRKDTGSHPGEGDMTGRMQYSNNSAVGDNWQISWGEALDILPRDDQERAMRAGVQPQMSQAEQNWSMVELLFGLFSPGVSSSSGSSTGSMIGCAPGYSGCPHIAGKH